MRHAQVAAGFSAGSAVAVLGGGFLFCRLKGGGRRNLTFLLCASMTGADRVVLCMLQAMFSYEACALLLKMCASMTGAHAWL